jgi:5-(carboxyamino)imidazole ribonucleotide synthase
MTSSPHPRIGILGAGQLALMLAQAARALDIEIICAGQPGDCAEQAAPLVLVDLEDPAAVAAFAATVDLVTIESENIDASVLRGLNLYPNARAIGIAQDRLLEKRFFRSCGIGVAPFAPVDTLEDLHLAIESTGLPAILKTRRMGYDGKGQVRLHTLAAAATAWASIGELPCILEGMVPFDAEVSLIAARNRSGAIVFYPLIQNHHRDGILRTSIAPFLHPGLQLQAERYLTAILQTLDYIGVLAVEFFVVGNTLLANEMAPRVHNSGHWTIEGSATSQFENHLRAILDPEQGIEQKMDFGSTASRPTVMLNCIGSMPPESETALYPYLFRHDYGKAPRPARKVGHLTLPASQTTAIDFWRTRLEQAG